MKRLFLLLLAASSAAACAVTEDRSEDVAESEDALRALTASEIVGTLAYGETSGPIQYTEDPTYRAFAFEGAKGDEIEIDVHADSADARAWLLAPNFRTLKWNDDASSSTRDSHVTHELTQTGKHYIAFREKNYEEATFTVSLKKKAAPVATDDPFDPSFCNEPPLTQAEAAAKFAPGGSTATLGQYEMRARVRSCTAVTGCSAWEPFTYSSPGYPSNAVPMKGETRLLVEGNAIDLRLVTGICSASNMQGFVYGPRCGHVTAPVSCGGYDYIGSVQWGGSGGTFCYASGANLGNDRMKPSGVVGNHCMRLTASGKTADGSKEYEAVIFARY